MPSTDQHRFLRRPLRTAGLLGIAVATALVSALTGTVTGAGSASAETTYGTITASDGVLPAANTCGTLRYGYDLAPPSGRWTLETFVVDPRGNTVSSFLAVGGYTPGGTNASTSYTLCTNNTAAGTFTITGKLTVDDDLGRSDSVQVYAVTPASFRMAAPATTRPAKHHKKRHKHRHHQHENR